MNSGKKDDDTDPIDLLMGLAMGCIDDGKWRKEALDRSFDDYGLHRAVATVRPFADEPGRVKISVRFIINGERRFDMNGRRVILVKCTEVGKIKL